MTWPKEATVSILIAGRRLMTIVVVLMCCAAPLLASQGTTGSIRGATERGRATFREYCAACHGDRGKGNTPGAADMKHRPSDLTMLTKRVGTFPAARVEATLKGTDRTSEHSPGMLVWRALFLADANGNEAVANARVKDVTAFIASIQAK